MGVLCWDGGGYLCTTVSAAIVAIRPGIAKQRTKVTCQLMSIHHHQYAGGLEETRRKGIRGDNVGLFADCAKDLAITPVLALFAKVSRGPYLMSNVHTIAVDPNTSSRVRQLEVRPTMAGIGVYTNESTRNMYFTGSSAGMTATTGTRGTRGRRGTRGARGIRGNRGTRGTR
ncbi:hypothetical protein LINGRAPRIM_LOCUS56, partial [Linum grandiflorum]